MNKFWLILRTLISYVLVIFSSLICFIPLFLIAALPERWRYDNRVYYFFLNLYYKSVLRATFLSIHIEGKENLLQEASIIVSNHQSSLDIPLLGSLVNGHPHVWLFLARFAKIPLFGFIARRMNVIVDHSGVRKLVGSLDKTISIIKQHTSHVMIFPEGGRYNDGKIHNFFYGFAVLAKEMQRPVIPVLMRNPGAVYPPGSFLMYPQPIHIIVGKPFYTTEQQTEEELVQSVRDWFVQKNAE